ncbi:MAG: winged helix-turn-helix transcriptional regulator [bacterium]|nr:winged helix-turn-helix transcriptional regulator [bacterium]
MITDEFAEFYALMCSTISKPIRLKILHFIGEGKVCVSDIQKEFDITMSSLSNHLSALYRAGVLGREKKGNYVYYYLTEPELLKGIAKMSAIITTISSKRNPASF